MDHAVRILPWQVRAFKLVAAGLGLMTLLAACGGGESTLNDLLDASADSDTADLDDLDISVGGIGVDTDGENGITTTLGDTSVGLGQNLDRPSWLEPWIQLPDGLSISIAVDDPSTGERAIQGTVSGTDAASVAAQQRAMLEAAGYEALQDSGYFVQAGRPSIEILARDLEDGTVGYVFEHSFETEQTLRDVYAAVEGTGTLTVSLNNEVFSFEGQCTLRSTSGQFTSDDAQGSLTIEVRDGEQDYILGNLVNADAETFESWTVLQQTETGEYPTVSVRQDGFQLDGFMVDWTFSNPTPVTMEVLCPS